MRPAERLIVYLVTLSDPRGPRGPRGLVKALSPDRVLGNISHFEKMQAYLEGGSPGGVELLNHGGALIFITHFLCILLRFC